MSLELYQDEIRAAGFLLGDRRRELGITQAELAERIGIAQTNVSDVELGLRDFRLSTMIRQAEALGCQLQIKLVRD